MINFNGNIAGREKSKAALRAEAKYLRASFDAKMLDEISSKVCDGVISLPEFCEADAIFCYSALNGEICTDNIVYTARKLGKAVAFPKCRGENMEFCLTNTENDLCQGVFGIKEPKDFCRTVHTDAFESVLVIVPALVFDRHGYRVGWGKGYYDRYFEKKLGGTTLVGVCSSKLLHKSIPHGEFDVPVDIVISEKEVLRIEGQ